MILPDPLKGEEVLYINPLVSTYHTPGNKRMFQPCLCFKNQHGEKFYLSWDNLQKILKSVDYDVDKKRVRKHLIPLIKEI